MGCFWCKRQSNTLPNEHGNMLSPLLHSSSVDNDSRSNKKIMIYVYFHDMKQAVAFYHGTESKEIENLIKKCFQLPLELEVQFCDESGIPLVLNTHISHETKIFMQRSKVNLQICNNNRNTKICSNIISIFDSDIDDDEEDTDSEDEDNNNSSAVEPVVTLDMRKWDKTMNLKGEISNYTWTAKGEWPYHCCTVDGISGIGGVYKYSVTFRSERADFLYVYHRFGVMFRDEIGCLKSHSVHVSYMPMFRFMSDMNRNIAQFEVIVDVRTDNEVNYNAHERGVYFILQPENRCLAYTSLFGKVPCVKKELLFAFWTKQKCSVNIDDVELVSKEYGMGQIKTEKQIENVAETKLEYWKLHITSL